MYDFYPAEYAKLIYFVSHWSSFTWQWAVFLLLFLIVVGTTYTQQSYKVSESFPFKWINKKWKEGFHVTSMTTAGSRWGVVMSRNSGYSNQVLSNYAIRKSMVIQILLFSRLSTFLVCKIGNLPKSPFIIAMLTRRILCPLMCRDVKENCVFLPICMHLMLVYCCFLLLPCLI